MSKGLQFTLEAKDIFSHLVLQDKDYAEAIAASKEWTEDGILEARLTINGIEVPAMALNQLLMEMWDQANDKARKLLDVEEVEKMIEARAKEILEEHTDNAIQKLTDIINTIEDPSNLITPTWEREKK